MNTKLKQTIITIATTLSAILIVTTATYAIGTLTPSGTPGDDTQVSLNDIYGALDDFSNHTVASTTNPIVVPGSVSASFHTLSEIYALISAESSDLVPENIADGVEIFGVEGTMTAGVSYPTEWSADEPSGSVSWTSAVSYCDSLTENSHTDWRLPTYIELVNAYLTTNPGNSLGFQSSGYWSSTENPDSTGNAYGVNMGASTGDAYSSAKFLPVSRARCTR